VITDEQIRDYVRDHWRDAWMFLHFDRCRATDEHFVARVLTRGASRRGNRFAWSMS
jgi:hypothetical protein